MHTFSKQLQSVVSPKFDQEVLVRVLEKTYKLKNVEIKNIQFSSKSKVGDSYLSIVSKFTVSATYFDEGKGKTCNVVVPIISKAFPSNIGRRKTFRSVDFFENEINFYHTECIKYDYNLVVDAMSTVYPSLSTWEAMNLFQLSKNSSPVFDSIPICISALCDGFHDYVTLEDLSFKGYWAISRDKPLDVDHVRLILKLFAKFHALGLAFKDQQPEKFEEAARNLKETIFSERLRPWYEKFQREVLFTVIRDAVQKQLALSYSEKLEQILAGDVYGAAIHLCGLKEKLAVISHGDTWAPNFLVNYVDDVPNSAYMIDFQLTRYASLAQDLLFFLYTCVSHDLRIQHWDSLLKFYHSIFVDILKTLGSSEKLLTMDDLRAEIKKHGMYGFNIGIDSVCMSMLEDDEVVDLDTIQGDDEQPLDKIWYIHPFKIEEKRQRLADFFKHMVDTGLI